MKTQPSFVGFNTLKRSVSIIQVLDRYGLLDRLHRSGDSLSGACPLHNGHNSSQFRVSTTKNCWICFGDCQVGGSIVDFVSRKEGVGIRDAALLIQDWFSVQPVNGRARNQAVPGKINGDFQSFPRRERLKNLPLTFVIKHLDSTHPYLTERGLLAETINTFGIGYCSKGLLAGWIAIPIHNASGQLIAYAGRWPGEPPELQPKYKLPKGFGKSQELFNLHRARMEDAGQPLVVVEGFFDCMKVWQAGHQRVVSTMGSMVSETQVRLIEQAVGRRGRVLLLFDEDPAGQKGCAKARSRLAKVVKVDVVRLAEGHQPDSLSPEELHRVIADNAR